eukprot:COSAG01_NODE_4710_length_4797_cov_62.853160_3_plen_68_part_00
MTALKERLGAHFEHVKTAVDDLNAHAVPIDEPLRRWILELTTELHAAVRQSLSTQVRPAWLPLLNLG